MTDDLLKFALENGIIDMSSIQVQIEKMKNEKYLKMHNGKIWQSDADMLWRTYLPDEVKGRKLVKRKTEEDLKNTIIAFYKALEKKTKEKEITLCDLFPEWLEFKSMHTDATSYIKRITADWSRYYMLEPELINKPIKEFSKVYLDQWAHGMIKKYDMTKKAYYNMSLILRQCLTYAVEKGCIETNEFEKVDINTKLFRRTKKKPSDTQVYNNEEEEKLIQDMMRRFKNNPSNTAPLMVLLAFETGVRIGELCALKFEDIDGRYINIQRQEVRDFEKVDETHMRFKCFRIVEYTKSDDGFRQIYLTETARRIIEIAKTMNEVNNEKNPDGFIFVKDGKNIGHYSVQAMIKRGCEHINIEVKTSHKIRKTFISTLIDSGLNIDEVRRVAGHSDERTTYGNYCFNRLTESQTENAYEKALNRQKVIKGNQFSNIVEFTQTRINTGFVGVK